MQRRGVRWSGILLLVISIAIGICVGAKLAECVAGLGPWYIAGRAIPLKLITASLAAGTALAFVREVWASITALQQLESSGPRINWRIATECGKVLLSAVGFSFAVFTLKDGNPNDDSHGRVIASTVVIGVGSEPSLRLPDRLLLPYFSYNLSEKDSLESCSSKIAKLATVDESAVQTIRTVACGLRMCSTAQKPVIVDIRGFASSKDFSCEGEPSSITNLQLAEQRRIRVIELLTGSLDGALNCSEPERAGLLKIKPSTNVDRWDGNYGKMIAERDFNDRPTGAPDRAREILTRRVDIVLLERGSCAD